MIRPKYGQVKNPMTNTRIKMFAQRLLPYFDVVNTATSAIANSSCGNASSRSMNRLMSVSVRPPK